MRLSRPDSPASAASGGTLKHRAPRSCRCWTCPWTRSADDAAHATAGALCYRRRMPPPVHNATLTRRIQEGLYNLVLGVRSDVGPLQFMPGQFVNLGALGEDAPRETRAYSVASAPGAPEAEFALTVVDTG